MKSLANPNSRFMPGTSQQIVAVDANYICDRRLLVAVPAYRLAERYES